MLNFSHDFSDMLMSHSGIRHAASTQDSEGRAKEGAESSFTFKGTRPQPAGQNDLKMLPNGSTPSSAITIRSVQPLRITENGKKGDIVCWQGDHFLVVQTDKRSSHSRSLCVKVQAGE